MVVTILITFMFKRDTEVSDHEAQLGKMHERTDDLRPARDGSYIFASSVAVSIYPNLLRRITKSFMHYF